MTPDTLARTCTDCAEPFSLAPTEIAWFTAKDLHLPRRCSACRRLRRAERGDDVGRRAASPDARPWLSQAKAR